MVYPLGTKTLSRVPFSLYFVVAPVTAPDTKQDVDNYDDFTGRGDVASSMTQLESSARSGSQQ